MKKLIILLLTLFLTACTVNPEFTSPITGNERIDFLNQAQKTIATIGAKYGYECKRGDSYKSGEYDGVYTRAYHFVLSPYVITNIYLDSDKFYDAIYIEIKHKYFTPQNEDSLDSNVPESDTVFISNLIQTLTNEKIIAEDINKFMDPNNNLHKINDKEKLDSLEAETYKYVEFDKTGYNTLEYIFYNPGYKFYYNDVIPLESQTEHCE